jgi:single-strand DNA-binding protein
MQFRAKTNMEEIIMALYENSIRLKGFVGKDAQSQATTNGKAVVVLSLATKSSYKDKKTNQWVARTEWHRIVCFAKPAEYAKGLKKGDYIEVEGELRSSEFDAEVGNAKQKTQVKRRSWEVRAHAPACVRAWNGQAIVLDFSSASQCHQRPNRLGHFAILNRSRYLHY